MSDPPQDPNAPGGPDDGSSTAEVIDIKSPRKKREPAVVLPVSLTPDWQSALRKTEKGVLTSDDGNAALLLTNDPDWAGCLKYNEFSDRITWYREPPAIPGLATPVPGSLLHDSHATHAQHWLACCQHTKFSKLATRAAMVHAARCHGFHPVRDYLRSLRWDGTFRLHNWLQAYLGASDEPYIHIVGRMWLISAVARVMQPGCQADHALVLEGRQGCGKSTAIAILAGDWYLPSLPDVQSKDSSQVLPGRWLAEIAELDAFRKAEVTRIKEYLTRRTDVYRPAYGEFILDQPRQVVFAGTTNDSHWHKDATGGRRFWPIPVAQLDRDTLTRDRDQLWAEAHEAYLGGAEWHPKDEATIEALTLAQDERFQSDDWERKVAAWVNETELTGSIRDGLSIGEVLSGALGVETKHHDQSAQTRVGAILTRMSWNIVRVAENGVRVRRYFRPRKVV